MSSNESIDTKVSVRLYNFKQQFLKLLLTDPTESWEKRIGGLAKQVGEVAAKTRQEGTLSRKLDELVQNERYRIAFAVGLARARHHELTRQLNFIFKSHFEIPKPIIEMMSKDFELPDEDLVGRIMERLNETNNPKPISTCSNQDDTSPRQDSGSSATESLIDQVIEKKLKKLIQVEKHRMKRKTGSMAAKRRACDCCSTNRRRLA